MLNKYKNDYEIVITEDEEGQEKRTTIYRGDYYETSLDDKGLAGFKKNCLLLFAMLSTLHIVNGFIKTQGMYQIYISLPYVFAYLALWNLATGALRLPKEKRKYRKSEIENSFKRIKTASFILFILLMTGIFGEILFLVFQKQTMQEYLYLILASITAGMTYLLINLQKKAQVRICAKE